MIGIDLTVIWAIIIAFGIIMYVLMDGFDLGIGMLFPFAPDESARDLMMNSVAPIWDGNETWLVLGGVGLFAAFPLVYAIYLPALYIAIFVMLAGLIFRGVAFEFRFKARRSKTPWNAAFAGGSALATFAQGTVVGTYIQGFETEGFVYTGTAMDWLTPFTLLTGFGLMAGYALLGATWLILKTEGDTQAWARSLTPALLVAVLAVFAGISIWTPLIDAYVRARWFGHFGVLWLLPALAAVFAWLLWRAVRQHRDGIPFLATMGLFVCTYLGLLVSKWPYVVPPEFTIWEAASAPISQLFLLLGVLFVIPIILGYTTWTYWIFRGKVRPGAGYH